MENSRGYTPLENRNFDDYECQIELEFLIYCTSLFGKWVNLSELTPILFITGTKKTKAHAIKIKITSHDLI
jgi:hypothetical protein